MPILEEFASELGKRFTGDIRLDRASRILYSTDASIYQIEPLGVVLPRTQDDLQLIMELAAKYRVPTLPRGAGTSLAGQAIGEAILVDCSKWLTRIVEVDPRTRTARVEPGVVLSDLNKEASRYGLHFGPDPASAERATMGGVVGNNATGAHSIIYGMTADHLRSAIVIFSDGSRSVLGAIGEAVDSSNTGIAPGSGSERHLSLLGAARRIRELHEADIRAGFPKTWRNSAGYRMNYLMPWSASSPPGWKGGTYPAGTRNGDFNLAQLLAGSEGTLAMIAELVVDLVPKPAFSILGVLEYRSAGEACDAVPDLLLHQPSAIELISKLILESARRIPAYARQMAWVSGDPEALLVVEFSGEDLRSLRQRIDRVGRDVKVIESSRDQAMIWETRKAGLGLLDSNPRHPRPTAFIEDCAVPVEHLGEFVRGVQEIMSQHRAEGGIYGHASAGCLHIRPVLDLRTGSGVLALREIAEQTFELTLCLGGSMVSEHGDGIARGEWLRRTYGDELASAMGDLKRAADPEGLLNPAKMLDAPPMDSHLRFGAEYAARPWRSGFNFEKRGGLALAIEQCNGQGVCRKDTGVMCPSFQATRDEQHSTRGRANLLRALISNTRQAMPTATSTLRGTSRNVETSHDLTAATFEALDLCLACKGCKAECPSGVDMAKLKPAFLENYYRTHRRPPRDYILGYFAHTARVLAAFAPVVNNMLLVPALRRSAARALGMAPEREFPHFAAGRTRPPGGDGARPVIYLRDPFTHYADSGVERAALTLLAAAGFSVQVLDTMGAGTALISKGFLSAARSHAHRLVDELERADPTRSIPLVSIEPSEISSIRDDYQYLFTKFTDAVSDHLARACSVEELVVKSSEFEEFHTGDSPKKILFHPHCHEKAELRAASIGTEDAFSGVELLRRCGFDVELIDAGCCGMGGTFGYEAEHHDLSRKIGGLRLFPIIAGSGGAQIAATGAACRLQIRHGTGAVVEHPVVLAARAIAPH